MNVWASESIDKQKWLGLYDRPNHLNKKPEVTQ
jgi:hypothetical protein